MKCKTLDHCKEEFGIKAVLVDNGRWAVVGFYCVGQSSRSEGNGYKVI